MSHKGLGRVPAQPYLVCRKENMMLPYLSTDLLRIPSENGSPINEYRIHSGQIEFRALDQLGHAFLHNEGKWKILEGTDLQLHFSLNTIVAQWLLGRLHAILYPPQPLSKIA